MLCNFWCDLLLSLSMRRHFAAAELVFQLGSLYCSSCLSKVVCIVKASETFFVDLVASNRLKSSWWGWNSSRQFSMYMIMASEWYRYCAIWWKYTKFLMHIRASVKVILWVAEGFRRVALKTGTITRQSAFISLPLHCVTCLYGLLNWAKTGYGGIIAQSWLHSKILECCLRKEVTQSIESLLIPN